MTTLEGRKRSERRRPKLAFPLETQAHSACQFGENISLSGGQKVQVQRTLFRNNVWPNLGDGGYQAVMDDWLSLPSFHAQWQSMRDGGRPMSIRVLDGVLVVASETRHDLCYCFEHRDAFNARFFKWTNEGWMELNA